MEWSYLPKQIVKSLQLYVEQIAKIVTMGRNRVNVQKLMWWRASSCHLVGIPNLRELGN